MCRKNINNPNCQQMNLCDAVQVFLVQLTSRLWHKSLFTEMKPSSPVNRFARDAGPYPIMHFENLLPHLLNPLTSFLRFSNLALPTPDQIRAAPST